MCFVFYLNLMYLKLKFQQELNNLTTLRICLFSHMHVTFVFAPWWCCYPPNVCFRMKDYQVRQLKKIGNCSWRSLIIIVGFLHPIFKYCFHRYRFKWVSLSVTIWRPIFRPSRSCPAPVSFGLVLLLQCVLTPAGCISFQRVPYFSHHTNHCSTS